MFSRLVSPEEVHLAEDVAVPDEALVLEWLVAVRTLQALGVPVLVQDPEDEPVQDHHPAAGALRDGSCNWNT